MVEMLRHAALVRICRIPCNEYDDLKRARRVQESRNALTEVVSIWLFPATGSKFFPVCAATNHVKRIHARLAKAGYAEGYDA
jgi:hypothetical protein